MLCTTKLKEKRMEKYKLYLIILLCVQQFWITASWIEKVGNILNQTETILEQVCDDIEYEVGTLMTRFSCSQPERYTPDEEQETEAITNLTIQSSTLLQQRNIPKSRLTAGPIESLSMNNDYKPRTKEQIALMKTCATHWQTHTQEQVNIRRKYLSICITNAQTKSAQKKQNLTSQTTTFPKSSSPTKLSTKPSTTSVDDFDLCEERPNTNQHPATNQPVNNGWWPWKTS